MLNAGGARLHRRRRDCLGTARRSSAWPGTVSSWAIATMDSGPAWTQLRRRTSWKSCGARAWRHGNSGSPMELMPTDHVQCRACGAALTEPFVDLGVQAACQFLSGTGEPCAGPSRSFRCASVCATGASSSNCRRWNGPRDLRRLCLLLVLLGAWLAPRQPLAEGVVERSGSARAAGWSRSPATTVTCCRTSSRRGIPVARHRAGGERGRGGAGSGSRRSSGSSAPRPARELVAEGTRPTYRRQQRARPCARPQRLRRRAQDRAQARRRAHDEFPHMLQPDPRHQFDTIYHEHYSYFSLLTSSRFRRPRPGGVRRRGAAHARRLATPLPAPRRRRPPSAARGRR